MRVKRGWTSPFAGREKVFRYLWNSERIVCGSNKLFPYLFVSNSKQLVVSRSVNKVQSN